MYGKSSSEELRILILKYSEAFMRDNNMGLAKQVSHNSCNLKENLLTISNTYSLSLCPLQVATSLYKRNIQRLTKTFLTLSLSDVASRVQLPSAVEAERYILNMVRHKNRRYTSIYAR